MAGLTTGEIAARIAPAPRRRGPRDPGGLGAAQGVPEPVRLGVRARSSIPGRKPLRSGTRLVDALLDAGGFSSRASGEVRIERQNGHLRRRAALPRDPPRRTAAPRPRSCTTSGRHLQERRPRRGLHPALGDRERRGEPARPLPARGRHDPRAVSSKRPGGSPPSAASGSPCGTRTATRGRGRPRGRPLRGGRGPRPLPGRSCGGEGETPVTRELTRASPPSPSPSTAGPERDFDVRYYTELLWRRRILLAATAIGGLALGILAGELQPPRYQARTLLQVMPPNPTSLAVTDALVGTGNPIRDRQFFNTQMNVLRSRSIAERVVDRLKLADRPEFTRGRRPRRVLPPAPRGGAGARHLRGGGPDHPPATRGRGAVGQHALQTSTWTTASRARSRPRSGPTSGSTSGSPTPRTTWRRRRTSSSRATRGRTCSCPRAASRPSPPRSPSSTRTTSRPRPGGSSSRPSSASSRRCGARGSDPDPIPQVGARTRWWPRSTGASSRSPSTSRACTRSTRRATPRSRRSRCSSSSCRRTRRSGSPRSRRACAPSTASSSGGRPSSGRPSTGTRAGPPSRAGS